MGFAGAWALVEADAWGFVPPPPPVDRAEGAAVLGTFTVGSGARPTVDAVAEGAADAVGRRAADALAAVVVEELVALGVGPPAAPGLWARIANAAIPATTRTPAPTAAIPTFERGGGTAVLAARPCVDESRGSVFFGATANGVSISAVFANMAASDTGAEGGTCEPGTIE